MVGNSLVSCRLPWLAAMRSAVAVRESSFRWRQTDDEHSTCVLRLTRVFGRGCFLQALCIVAVH